MYSYSCGFCIMCAACCIRFTHIQRSKLIQDHVEWLEFKCSQGKSRRAGARPPYRWALPEVRLDSFSLLDEIRPVVMRQREMGANHLFPGLQLEGEDLCQVVEATPLVVARTFGDPRFVEILRGLLSRCGLQQGALSTVHYNRCCSPDLLQTQGRVLSERGPPHPLLSVAGGGWRACACGFFLEC